MADTWQFNFKPTFLHELHAFAAGVGEELVQPFRREQLVRRGASGARLV